jgi:RND family efflux transporter MFP subunit
MKLSNINVIVFLVIIIFITSVSLFVYHQNTQQKESVYKSRKKLPIPVEATQIQTGAIALRRTFSGTLETHTELIIAPKISGRIKHLQVNIADKITKGMLVAEMDSDEYIQDVTQAEADLEMAKAKLMAAKNALKIVNRELKRIKVLRERGVKSDSQFDLVKANQLAKQAEVAVAKANLTKAEAALKTANIRLGYTKVIADWTGKDTHRVVAETYVNEGDTVSANTPFLLVVQLNPITGVIFVTEKDYTRLSENQIVMLSTDAYKGENFQGRIHRIAPVFQKTTRQARIELLIDNPLKKLKPGMFIRANVLLRQEKNAVIVPQQAITIRNDKTGIFVIDKKQEKVTWRNVTTGIVENGMVQVKGDSLSGYVVTLGQQLLANHSAIVVSSVKPAEFFSQKKAGIK